MTKGSRVLLGLAWKLSLATAALALFMAIRSALYETGVDYQQGALFRLLYIHVPAAWFSLLLLITLATAQLVYSTTGARWLLKVLGVSLAIGLPCTVIVLATGLYWGRLIWGGVVYLDPRIVAQIFVLALYLVYALLRITKVYTLYVSATTWAA
ncbi:MAG: cytochrome c biogenesis protein CcsA, partial [Gammaproteobacteria bacterium]